MQSLRTQTIPEPFVPNEDDPYLEYYDEWDRNEPNEIEIDPQYGSLDSFNY